VETGTKELLISASRQAEILSDGFSSCDLASSAEAFIFWDGTLSAEDKETVRQNAKSDLILYHHGWGMGIRNGFCLWKGGALQTWFMDRGVSHPDSMSMILIELYWAELNECRPDIKNIVQQRLNNDLYNCPETVAFE
jgi:hypothetical protein